MIIKKQKTQRIKKEQPHINKDCGCIKQIKKPSLPKIMGGRLK